MANDLRKTGISVVGDVPWGTHFCYFYETTQDLLDTLVPYFMAGLKNKEFCLWIISNSELLTSEEAKEALRQALPDLERYLAQGSIEIVSHEEWFHNGETFDLHRVANRFKEKLDQALARGYAGMRVNGSPAWLQQKDMKQFLEFEAELDTFFSTDRIIASCTYPLAWTRGSEIFDVTRRHHFAIAKRRGQWEVVETPELKQAKADIQRLNEQLEQRVGERTSELRVANEELRKEITERKQAEALLHAKEQDFRVIVENTPDQIIRYDREFRRTYVNPAVAQAYGLPAEALIGKLIGSVIQDAGLDVKADELAQIRQRIAAVFETGKSYEYEMNWPLPTGRKYYSVRFSPELDLNGSVINVLGIARDITERKRAENERRTQKEILQKIFDHSPVMIGFIDADGHWEMVNRAWERTVGWTLEELQNPDLDIFAEVYPDPRERQRVLDLIVATAGEWADFKARARDGRVLDVTFANVRLSDGTTLGFGLDITTRKQAEAEKARLFAQLQLLSRQLLQAQEVERRSIARELHDEIGQRLTGLGLLLSSQHPSLDQLTDAQAIVRDLIARLRTLSLDLRPTILDDLGLLPALVWLFERYTAQTNVSVRFEHRLLDDQRFDPDVEITAYRIIQEALTNVARHAGVNEVTVRLWTDDDTLTVVIVDQGRGFDPQRIDTRASSGLTGMQERAALLGGSLTIEAFPGAGTRLTATLPLHRGAGSREQEQSP